jgi:hypothetical protein
VPLVRFTVTSRVVAVLLNKRRSRGVVKWMFEIMVVGDEALVMEIRMAHRLSLGLEPAPVESVAWRWTLRAVRRARRQWVFIG